MGSFTLRVPILGASKWAVFEGPGPEKGGHLLVLCLGTNYCVLLGSTLPPFACGVMPKASALHGKERRRGPQKDPFNAFLEPRAW